MKKIVYVMNVDWNWIKQRPHFIAEGLAQNNDITILYQHRYGRKGYQKRDAEGLRIKPVYVIPRGDRYGALRKLNRRIKDGVIRRQAKGADCLYLTFPDQVGAIPEHFGGKVLYDCMDNHPAFLKDSRARQELERQEAALVDRADGVLVSSLKLKEELLKRYGQQYETKITLVRNGYNAQDREVPMQTAAGHTADAPYTIAYFGTISSWFNFPFLEKSVAEFPNLHYLLMGPLADGAVIPDFPQIRYIGTVEHKALGATVADTDCLMMPFVVNEIIESVDPVKLYEYINFNKNILCVRYAEVERFAPFVHFYTDYESYREQLVQLMADRTVKYTEEQRIAFLRSNSWTSRVEIIEALLEGM